MASAAKPAAPLLIPATPDDVRTVEQLLGPKYECHKIMCVNNPALSAMHDMYKAFLVWSNAPGAPQWGFHATTRQATGSIIRTGFDVSISGRAHGTALGVGIYMAQVPDFADRYAKFDATNKRCMFVCKTLPGNDKQHKTCGDQTVYRREQQVLPVYLVYYSR